MATPVKLATPYPTIEDAAKIYGISSSRLRRLKQMVQALLSRGQSKTTTMSRLTRKANSKATRSRANQSSHRAQTMKRRAKAK